MCGRYRRTTQEEELRGSIISRSQSRLIYRSVIISRRVRRCLPFASIRRRNSDRRCFAVIVPSWATDLSIGNKLLNARSDGVATKPSFRSAFKRRRCLLIADGFYEWRKTAKPKLPFAIAMKDGRPFTFAGLWENWRDPESGEWLHLVDYHRRA